MTRGWLGVRQRAPRVSHAAPVPLHGYYPPSPRSCTPLARFRVRYFHAEGRETNAQWVHTMASFVCGLPAIYPKLSSARQRYEPSASAHIFLSAPGLAIPLLVTALSSISLSRHDRYRPELLPRSYVNERERARERERERERERSRQRRVQRFRDSLLKLRA